MKSLFYTLAFLVLVACNSSEQAPVDNTKSASDSAPSQVENDLHDIWALDWMTGINMDSVTFMKGTPTLELYPKDSSVLGHTGCNQLNGRLVLTANKGLRFDKLATTKMFCQGANEPVFLDNLTKTTRYVREDLMLLFLQDDMVIMRFKKVD
jgi:heat shock protein HslJ